jgi:uncharacterized NAD-dependent epimerase/dehydratase family protein
VFLGDVEDALTAKTAFGLRDWARNDVVGQWRCTTRTIDLGLPDLTPHEAIRAGARSVVVGAAPSGGALVPGWAKWLAEAALAGLDVISGMHEPLSEHGALLAAANCSGVNLFDIRTPPPNIPIGSGQKRSGKRVLTVGADCAVGKKYAALAIHREMLRRAWDVDFRATGQTGIIIAGGGIPIDAVVSDFVAGAAETLSPKAARHHWDVIEGQGSLFHPSYAGVSLGLLHGSQPDWIVYCHSLSRTEIDGCPGFLLPDVETGLARNLEAARLTNVNVRAAGISVNTSDLCEQDARHTLTNLAEQYHMPAFDPLRFGVEGVVDRMAAA